MDPDQHLVPAGRGRLVVVQDEAVHVVEAVDPECAHQGVPPVGYFL
jgi:hypothetical protein